jgi:putative ABC transport system substrate-binding protein
VGVLVNPDNPSNATVLKNLQSAAQKVNVRLVPVEVRTVQEIDSAFPVMTQGKAEAVFVAADALLIQQTRRIAELAVTHRLPSIGTFRDYAEAGGLMSYGSNLAEQFRRAAGHVDKIFKGAKPGELPVEQSATFELLINSKTAKALRLTIPKVLLFRADKVIE